jgi:phospholipid/cholesterol/gamma-HCH transport system permease protein
MTAAMTPNWLESATSGPDTIWQPIGEWLVGHAVAIEKSLARQPRPSGAVQIDLGRLEALDTAGAMLLWQLYDRLLAQGYKVEFGNIPESFTSLFSAVGVVRNKPMPRPERINPFYARLIALGKASLGFAEDTLCFLSFLGLITLTLWRNTIQPWRLRFTSTIHHIEETGLKALPIVGLLSFLIGVVIAYQGADQLRQFGADLYVVNLLAVSVLREIGVLMTAIIIAGRSGSAFTAQLGTMQVNQEIDALRTLGLDPAELLVLPRVIAMVIVLPLLTVYANIMALLGGAVMCWVQLDISFGPFLRQLREAVDLWTLWVGLIKAPVFAFVIAVVGCYQGFRVTGSAESVGQLTTRSVVHAIFLVILLDAFFSILFARLGI